MIETLLMVLHELITTEDHHQTAVAAAGTGRQLHIEYKIHVECRQCRVPATLHQPTTLWRRFVRDWTDGAALAASLLLLFRTFNSVTTEIKKYNTYNKVIQLACF